MKLVIPSEHNYLAQSPVNSNIIASSYHGKSLTFLPVSVADRGIWEGVLGWSLYIFENVMTKCYLQYLLADFTLSGSVL